MKVKELSIEEKACRYDEAIEKLRNLHDDYDCVSALIDIKKELEYIFPELAESEDERIRKWLEEHIEAMPDNSIEFKDVKRIDVLHWLEKQGEQKIAEWSEDDEQYLLVCKNALAEYQDKWDARIISHWLENKLEVSRNRWRPSDEHIDRLIWVINRLPNTKRAKETKAVIEDLIEQLKKLRMEGGKK